MSSSQKADLRLDWCSYDAAKYAVMHWHYSRRMPKSTLVHIGAWERGEFAGSIVYGLGATPEICKPFRVSKSEACELVRVAIRHHTWATSRAIAVSLRMLRRLCPGLRVVVSFADTTQGHHGGIYQAGNWLFVGTQEYHAYKINGEIVHPRTCYHRWGVGGQSVPWLREHIDPHAERIRNGQKHKYVMPLDPAMREQIEPLRKPYPKRAGSVDSDTSADQAGEGGATPTPALQTEEANA